MILRCAFFRGRVRPGSEDAFRTLLVTRLIPLWRCFPGAEEVRVLDPVDADPGAPPIHMVLAVRYPDRATMDAALASEVREATRAPTRDLLALFDGDVFHLTLAGTDHLAAR